MDAIRREDPFHIRTVPKLARHMKSFLHRQWTLEPAGVSHDVQELVEDLLCNAQTPTVLADFALEAFADCLVVRGAGHRPEMRGTN